MRGILKYQASDTVANIRSLSWNVKIRHVLEVVSAANESQNRLKRAIPKYPDK